MCRNQILFSVSLVVFLMCEGLHATQYTIPKGPLRVSNSGFVLSPELMFHPNEFAAVLKNGSITHFKNILLSPNEPINARCDDGVYRKIHFNLETGKAYFSSGKDGETELTRPESLTDLRDYFISLKMDKNPVINKFLQSSFPGTEIGNGSEPPSVNPQNNPRSTHSDEENRNQIHPTAVPAPDVHEEETPKAEKTPKAEQKAADDISQFKVVPAPELDTDTEPEPAKAADPKPQTVPEVKAPVKEEVPSTNRVEISEARDFECIQSNGGFRPQHKQFKKPLGAGTMRSLQECRLAIKASRNGVVCSSTGLPNGFKPTYLKGVTPSRPDWGYVGGSSMSFKDCLFATERSTSTHVCYWGGSGWYATHPTGDKSSKGGPFKSVESCVDSYGGRERVAAPVQPRPNLPETPRTPPAKQTPTVPQQQPKQKQEPKVQRNEPRKQPNEAPGLIGRFFPRPEPEKRIGRKIIDFFRPHSTPEKPRQSRVIPSAAKGHELIGGNCMSCHNSQGEASEFPAWLSQQGELARRISSNNVQEKLEAQDWLRKLNQVLNLDNSMPPKSRPDKRQAFLNNPNAASFKAWISQENDKLSGKTPPQNRPVPPHGEFEPRSSGSNEPPTRPQTTAAKNSVQLLPQNKLNFYRTILPKVENPELEAILKDPNTLFFDRQSMVPGYQDPSMPVSGVRTTEQGFRGAPFGQGADRIYLDGEGHLRMFSKGVGLQGAGNTETFHFIHLPKDANGNLQKIKVVKRRIPPDETPVYDWVFPVGTVSGEIVYNKDSSGKSQVLEIRTRTKDNAKGAWAPDIMRPFPTAGSLSERLTEVAQTNPALRAEAEAIQNHLSNKARLQPLQIKRDGYQKGNFESSGGTDVLPNMSESMVRALLATPFKSSLGAQWDSNGSVTAFAPTSNQANGIVPQHGRTGAIRVDRESCNKCHEESNKPIRNFFNENHPMYYQSIVAYGNLPGSDRNLRFTIFDQKHFSKFGSGSSGDNRVIRQELMPILDLQQ